MPSDGRFVQVTTPDIMRATDLMEIYNNLKNPHLNIEELLTILLSTQMTVEDRKNNEESKDEKRNPKLLALIEEILELIRRQADLLHRGRPEKSLEGLRVRLANLFLQFIEIPESNPESSASQKIPAKLLQKDLKRAKLTAAHEEQTASVK